MSKAPVEVTTRHVTTVNDLPAAWAFVMERLERLGPDPSIEITPFWAFCVGGCTCDSADEEKPTRQFSVVVSGMIEEGKADE